MAVLCQANIWRATVDNGTITPGGGTNVQQLTGVNGGGFTGTVSQVGNNATITFPGPVTNATAIAGNNITISCVTNGNVVTCTYNGLASSTTGTTTIVTSGNFLTDNIQGGTNTLAFTEDKNAVTNAIDFMKFDGSDDTTNLIRMLAIASNNIRIKFPNKTATLATNWLALLTVAAYSPTNVEWDMNGCLFNVTKTNSQGGSGFIDLANVGGLYIHDGRFSMPLIGTNNTAGNAAQQGAMFLFGGATNQVLRMERLGFNGGRFGMQQNLAVWNYDFDFVDIVGTNIGNFNAGGAGSGDGALIEVSGSRINFLRCSANFMNWNFIELYNAGTSQNDCGPYSFNQMSGLNVSGDQLFDTTDASNSNATSIVINDWTMGSPNAVAGGLYNGQGIRIVHSMNTEVRNVTILTNGVSWTGFGLQVTGSNKLVVADFNGVTTETGDTITSLNGDLQDDILGGYTISAGTTCSVQCVFGTEVNSGVVPYRRDCAGNTTESGSLAAAGVLNGGFYGGTTMVVSNGTTLGGVGTTNGQFMAVDSSAGAITIPFKVSASGQFPIGRQVAPTLTNATPNTATLDFGAGNVNLGSGSRVTLLKKQGDTVTVRREAGALWSQTAGNVWSNMTVNNLYFSDGTVQTTAATNTVDSGGGGANNTFQVTQLTSNATFSTSLVSAPGLSNNLVTTASGSVLVTFSGTFDGFQGTQVTDGLFALVFDGVVLTQIRQSFNISISSYQSICMSAVTNNVGAGTHIIQLKFASTAGGGAPAVAVSLNPDNLAAQRSVLSAAQQ